MDNEQGTPVAAPGNGDSTPPERENLKAMLEDEEKSREAVKERDDRIEELESLLEAARDELVNRRADLDNAWAETTALQAEKEKAMCGCRDALRLAHPEIPPDLIRGETVEELSASVESAKALVQRVRAALQSEKDAARVPAGAPVGSGPDPSGLSAREKISAGVATAK